MITHTHVLYIYNGILWYTTTVILLYIYTWVSCDLRIWGSFKIACLLVWDPVYLHKGRVFTKGRVFGTPGINPWKNRDITIYSNPVMGFLANSIRSLHLSQRPTGPSERSCAFLTPAERSSESMPGASEVMSDGSPKHVAFDLAWKTWGDIKEVGPLPLTNHNFPNKEVISYVKDSLSFLIYNSYI